VLGRYFVGMEINKKWRITQLAGKFVSVQVRDFYDVKGPGLSGTKVCEPHNF